MRPSMSLLYIKLPCAKLANEFGGALQGRPGPTSSATSLAYLKATLPSSVL